MSEMVGFDMAQRRGAAGLRGGRHRARRTSTWSSCTTASRTTSCSPTRRSACAPEGGAEKFIGDGDNTYGGKVVTNPSGGLLSQGPSARRHRPRAVHRARRSSCAARPTSARSKARGSRCSTTSASAAPASSRCTSASEAEPQHDRQEMDRPRAAGVGAADRAQPAAVLRQGDRRDRPGLHRRRRGARRRLPRPARAADLPVRGRARLRRCPTGCVADLQIPIAKLLHGEQSFTYHRAGLRRRHRDRALDASATSTTRRTARSSSSCKTSRATNQRDELVAELRTVIVCRH